MSGVICKTGFVMNQRENYLIVASQVTTIYPLNVMT